MINEKQLQKSCVNYLRQNKRALFCHIPNEVITIKKDNYRLRNFRYQQGVSKGAPDIIIFNNNDFFLGLAIELKYKNNKPTDAQILWLSQLYSHEWFSCWINDFNVFINLVETYLNKPQSLILSHKKLKKNNYFIQNI